MKKSQLFKIAIGFHGDTVQSAAKKFGVTAPYLHQYFAGREISVAVEQKVALYINEALSAIKTIEPIAIPKNDVTPFSSEFVPPSPIKSRRKRLAHAQSQSGAMP